MTRYELHAPYQKAVDVVADRFYKAMGLVTLVCFSFTWAIFSHEPALMNHALDIGAAVLIGMFLVMALIRPSAVRKVSEVEAHYAEDHRDTFGEEPRLALTGLFP